MLGLLGSNIFRYPACGGANSSTTEDARSMVQRSVHPRLGLGIEKFVPLDRLITPPAHPRYDTIITPHTDRPQLEGADCGEGC